MVTVQYYRVEIRQQKESKLHRLGGKAGAQRKAPEGKAEEQRGGRLGTPGCAVMPPCLDPGASNCEK